MKYLVFDAGPLISLTLNGLLDVLKNLKQVFRGEFIITNSVKYEVVDRPMKIKKYKLEAIKIQNLIDEGILKNANNYIDENNLKKETQKVLKESNNILSYNQDGKKINIIQEGEASCLAFCNLAKEQSMIVVDERTTRFLSERPEKLEEMMEKKLHTNLDININSIKSIQNHKIIRSAELLFIAYKKNIIGIKKSKDLIDALLYGVKYKGTAISNKEIEILKQYAHSFN